jgi:AcrR family transcriptional regulator
MREQRTAGRRPRDASLSRDAVTQAAIKILDESGQSGLTFRVLAERLHSGAGAIYWHVANRSQLLDLACDSVLSKTEHITATADADEIDSIRALALSLFDTLDQHPWIGVHLPSSPGMPTTLRALDHIGTMLQSLGVKRERQFYIATAIFTYVIGVAVQMTRNAQAVAPAQSQDAWLAEQAQRWAQLDPDTYPFLHSAAADVGVHDDRGQFLAGLDLMLEGIRASRV